MRSLKNLSVDDAQKNGWDILKPLNCEVVGKAVLYTPQYESEKIYMMKSTKRFKVEGGWIYNTSTEVHKNESVSVAEALVFVPDA